MTLSPANWTILTCFDDMHVANSHLEHSERVGLLTSELAQGSLIYNIYYCQLSQSVAQIASKTHF